MDLRTYMATAAMQGFLSSIGDPEREHMAKVGADKATRDVAKASVAIADALIARLNAK